MKKRTSASNIMRLVSILGIICLLALQWVWWRNAYRAVEVDVMSKVHECLKKATSEEILYQMDSTSTTGIKIIHDNSMKIPEKGIVLRSKLKNSEEFEFFFEKFITLRKHPVTETKINVRFKMGLVKNLGFVPKYSLRIVTDSTQMDSTYKAEFNRFIIGHKNDTILHQFGYQKYIEVELISPIKLILLKGKTILFISIFLALLLGAILIFQYISMQRERKFSDFIIDYTRMITHDLRTPVTSLQMIFAMFLKSSTSAGSKEKYTVEGLSLTKKILLNLDNILYMAKSEQRELPVHKTEVNIGEFMEKTVKLYRERNYNPKVVSIETVYEPAVFNCNMDSSLMENAICNLLENAIKFTGMECKIIISCIREKDVVEFRCRDNGIGMTEEDQKRIFEIFERGSANKNKQFPGFGIGLHFVQRVVKAHGGKITVKSEIGQGTEFTIRFFA